MLGSKTAFQEPFYPQAALPQSCPKTKRQPSCPKSPVAVTKSRLQLVFGPLLGPVANAAHGQELRESDGLQAHALSTVRLCRPFSPIWREPKREDARRGHTIGTHLLILFSLIDDSIANNGGHPFVLPAASSAAYAALARSAFLCARAAD